MVTAVSECRVLSGCRLWVRFEDGVEGIADLAHLRGHGLYEAWTDPEVFARATINPTSRSVVWPGGVDVNPVVLRRLVDPKPVMAEDNPTRPSRQPLKRFLRAAVGLFGGLLAWAFLLSGHGIWIGVGFGSVLLILLVVGMIQGAQAKLAGICPRCGYGLHGLPPTEFGDVRCPECGHFSRPA